MVMRSSHRLMAAVCGVATALVVGCGSPKGSAPDKDVSPPPQTDTPTTTASGTAGARAPALASGDPAPSDAPAEIPTLVLERFKTAMFNPDEVFAIDGAVVVVIETFKPPWGITLGRVVGDTVEPFGSRINNLSPAGGDIVTDVRGYYPDGVDVYTQNNGGRIASPAITPATGKATPHVYGGAGGAAIIHGVARVGESSILSGWAQFQSSSGLERYRGPAHKLVRQTQTQVGCLPASEEDMGMWFGHPSLVALDPRIFGATRAGTILSVGRLCPRPGKTSVTAGAEIWTGNEEKSRIEDLSSVMDVGSFYWAERDFQGKGDEMWYGGQELEYTAIRPLLHYKDGHFERVNPPGKHIVNIAAAPSGELYISDGETLFRRDEGKWTPIARFDWPRTFETFAVYEGAFWASTNKQVFRLKPGKGVEPRDDCPSPFVYIKDVDPERAWKERYPNTAAAIGSFPEAADLAFLAFTVAERPRIGVSVKSNAQGKALIEHLRPLLPDTSPRLVCFAPDKPRKIGIPANKK